MILASDYDGTLRIKDEVKQVDKQAIQTWRKQGHVFGIVTGRSMESIRKEIAVEGIEVDFIIGNNGGVVYDANFQELKSYYMDFEAGKDMIAYLKRSHCISYVVNDGYHRAKVVVDSAREDIKYPQQLNAYKEADMLANGKIAQLVASLDNDEDAHTIASYINTHFQQYAVAYRNINCVDIAPANISKATGLQFLQDAWKLEADSIYTIGDSYNDIPMLTAFHGFATAHAPQDIQEQIGRVAIGVADCIDKIQKKDY